MALVLLHFARESGPNIYGELSIYLILISYSSFAVLGINASYVKSYSVSDNVDEKKMLTVFNFSYNLLVGVFLSFFIYMLIDGESVLFLCVICSLNLIRGSIQSILRAELRVYQLSLFNLLFSIAYLFLYYLGVHSTKIYEVEQFLIYWSWALLISVFFGFIFVAKVVMSSDSYSLSFIKNNFLPLIKGSILLFIINFGNTVILTSDRFLLNLFSIPTGYIGKYQFADNLSAMFYLGTSAILYLFVPVYLKNISNGSISAEKFTHKFLKFAVFLLVPLLSFAVISYAVIEYIFPEYTESFPIFLNLLLVKYFCLLLFIPITIYTALNFERALVSFYIFSIAAMLILQILIILVFKDIFSDFLNFLPFTSVLAAIMILIASKCRYRALANK